VMCWLLFCLFLFFNPFVPIVVHVSFTIDTCVFFLLYIHQKIMMNNLLLHLFWCLANYFFALYFVDACISCNTFYLYCILFKCTYFVSLPLKKAFEWKKIGFLKHNWRHIHKTIILIPWILQFFLYYMHCHLAICILNCQK
jgi:hypothetical protein